MKEQDSVSVWEEDVVIPAYSVSAPDKNPMFLEKRAYQGSSGKVYPLPVTEKIYDTRHEKIFHAVFMENKYIRIMILPELGGRIHRALDKTNNYDFVYYNRVIKPALVGLVGPWISGGIEFNWPQHHRPSTFSPVDVAFEEGDDGSKTVWCAETDKMYGTRGAAGFTLYPGKAYIEVRGRVFNRTDIPQTFLWWANPAVSVNEHTYSVFPPDVEAVMDHGRRAVTTFPIATGEYYKFDYSSGVDISRYKNIPVPTSYMADHSDYDFIGNYDEGKKSGLLHIADHHISPGKKQWTWGNTDFGQAWDRNLTDSDGPYIELMAGVFSNNQPDFTWLRPYEEKTFRQYFMPYKEVGRVKNATKNAALNFHNTEDGACLIVYATSFYENVRVEIRKAGKSLWNAVCDISPEKPRRFLPVIDSDEHAGLHVSVNDSGGACLVDFTVPEDVLKPIPDQAEALPPPDKIRTNEELYLAGQYLEQYRHTSREPESYYLEGLRRDPEDSRINNAYGLLLYRQGRFSESEERFRRSIKKTTWLTPNPYCGEAFFNLGLALCMLDRRDEAFDAFYKAAWSAETQHAGFYYLACLSCEKGKYEEALDFLDISLSKNWRNMKTRVLKAAALRHVGKDAGAFIEESLRIDRLDCGILNERRLYGEGPYGRGKGEEKKHPLSCDVNGYLELSLDYMKAGLYADASAVLESCPYESPMVHYYLALFAERRGDTLSAARRLASAETACPDYCFPNKIEEIPILEFAVKASPGAARAPYYLGNLLYDKKQYERAAMFWEMSIERAPDFPIAHRNLSIYHFNKRNDSESAMRAIHRAFMLLPTDSRLLLEYDRLSAMTGVPVGQRLRLLEEHMETTRDRDDLYAEYIALLNADGQFEKALDCLSSRRFHPWEGGEGRASSLYVYALVELAKRAAARQAWGEASGLLRSALSFPENLGEGKLPNAQDNIVHYYLGVVCSAAGENDAAHEWWKRASMGLTEPSEALYYNDPPSDTIFYQGLACERLGRKNEARKRYHRLLLYGRKRAFEKVEYDYFAVSLPEMSVYQPNLVEKNAVYCGYLRALGYIGLGEKIKAKRELVRILSTFPDYLGSIRHLPFCSS